MRYPDGEGVEAWFGRAYWIGEDLKGSFHTEQKAARKQLNSVTDRVINAKKEGSLFREMLSKGLWKYKPGDFKSEAEREFENKITFNPWNTK